MHSRLHLSTCFVVPSLIAASFPGTTTTNASPPSSSRPPAGRSSASRLFRSAKKISPRPMSPKSLAKFLKRHLPRAPLSSSTHPSRPQSLPGPTACTSALIMERFRRRRCVVVTLPPASLIPSSRSPATVSKKSSAPVPSPRMPFSLPRSSARSSPVRVSLQLLVSRPCETPAAPPAPSRSWHSAELLSDAPKCASKPAQRV